MRLKNHLSRFAVLGVAFAVFLFSPTAVFAGIGVSPASISNENLKPGSEFSQEIMISQSDASSDLVVSLEADLGDANAWVSFEPSSQFTITKGVQRYPITVKFNPPANVSLQEYNGAVRIKASSSSAAQTGGVSVVKGARVEVNLVTTNLDFVDLLVRSISVKDFKRGEPMLVDMSIENKGNVASAPSSVQVQVLDLNQDPVGSYSTSEVPKVAVNATETVQASINGADLPAAEYFGMVKVLAGEKVLREERVVFKVAAGSGTTTGGNPASNAAIDSKGVVALAIAGIISIVVIGGVYVFTRRRMKS